MTSISNTVLYIGITNDLVRRVYEHKSGSVSGFTSKYKVHKLVYFEQFETPDKAIRREKQLKGGSRQRKIDLIRQSNPEFEDLYGQIVS